MLEGFYTAASGILMQQRTMSVLTNNISNAKTPGFRADRVVSQTFDQELLVRREGGKTIQIGTSSSPICVVRDVPVDMDNASLEETGRPYDMAINGMGFFNIFVQSPQNGQNAQPDRQLLTRNGNFDVDAEGFLVLPGFGKVLGQKGEIKLEDYQFTVDQDGSIYDSTGKMLDKLLITEPAKGDDVKVKKYNNGMYEVADPAQNVMVTEVKVEQNQLERSNMDPNKQYTLVMESQRALQSCAAALKIVDTMNQKSSTQIASL